MVRVHDPVSQAAVLDPAREPHLCSLGRVFFLSAPEVVLFLHVASLLGFKGLRVVDPLRAQAAWCEEASMNDGDDAEQHHERDD